MLPFGEKWTPRQPHENIVHKSGSALISLQYSDTPPHVWPSPYLQWRGCPCFPSGWLPRCQTQQKPSPLCRPEDEPPGRHKLRRCRGWSQEFWMVLFWQQMKDLWKQNQRKKSLNSLYLYIYTLNICNVENSSKTPPVGLKVHCFSELHLKRSAISLHFLNEIYDVKRPFSGVTHEGITNHLYFNDAVWHCDTGSLTAGERGVKGSLCGSIRPRTDATAGGADTHSAGMRPQTPLGKVESPERKESRAEMTDCPPHKTTKPSVWLTVCTLSSFCVFHLLCCCRVEAA